MSPDGWRSQRLNELREGREKESFDNVEEYHSTLKVRMTTRAALEGAKRSA
jgi:hypothetical protein